MSAKSADLRFDYAEGGYAEGLDFWFDGSHTAGALFVTVHDRENEDAE